MPEPKADRDLLLSAAPGAGEIAMQHFRADPKKWEKPGDLGPVTEADLAVDTFLRETLCAARPDYGWLSEETEDTSDRLSQDTVFIVDPIDGTRSFIAGHENFSHALAVCHKGQVTAAVVHMPAKGLTYAAALGHGATLNGAPLEPSTRTELRGADILAAKAQMQPALWRKGPPPVERHFRSSLAYRLCLVAQGRFDGMLTLRPSWEWDIAAGCLIATEVGLRVTDRGGQLPRFNSAKAQTDGIMVAPDALHQGLMSYL